MSSGADWEYEWLGGLKKKRRRTPQQRALEERRRGGRKFATPDETRTRVQYIRVMYSDGTWKGRHSVFELSKLWDVSVSRVEQLAAEAKRGV